MGVNTLTILCPESSDDIDDYYTVETGGHQDSRLGDLQHFYTIDFTLMPCAF